MVHCCIIFNVLLFALCINAINNSFGSQRSPSSDIKIFINKCCPFGMYVGKRKSCVQYNDTLSFSKIEVYDEKIYKTEKSLETIFSLIPNKFEDKSFRDKAEDVEYPLAVQYNAYLTESGVLQIELPNSYNRWTPIPIDNYCVDYIIKPDPKKIMPRFWGIVPEKDNVQNSIRIAIAALISCFFMLLVLVVYFLLPELQNLCGLILMAYVFSLFMAFLLLSIIQIIDTTIKICIGLTMSIYFFTLATFCWMSVMSYDIWWTFRGYAKARPIHRRGEFLKFLMYALFAFGVPLIMTIGLAVLNVFKEEMRQLPWFVTPHLPEFGCFLDDGVKYLYLYMPMLILIICNWMFYLMTAFNIWRLSRGSAVLDSAAAGSPIAHRTHRHRFMIYLKLSIVMGLNWLLEIVSFLYPGFKIWLLSDIYNTLIGLAIFLIFVCKKKILRKLCKRFLGMKTMRWYKSSKSYSSSISYSSKESATLQFKVSSQPNGLNGQATISKNIIN